MYVITLRNALMILRVESSSFVLGTCRVIFHDISIEVMHADVEECINYGLKNTLYLGKVETTPDSE